MMPSGIKEINILVILDKNMVDDVYKIKVKVMVDMTKSFYTDFMPIISRLKEDVAKLQTNEMDESIISDINENLSRAESILITLNNVADKAEGDCD